MTKGRKRTRKTKNENYFSESGTFLFTRERSLFLRRLFLEMGGENKDRARKMDERLFFKRRLKMISIGRLFGEMKKRQVRGKKLLFSKGYRIWELEN
jgi:hypothetical protein